MSSLACDRCGASAPRYSTASRVAIDIEIDHPVLLWVTVSVHRCVACQHYFRAQPPFLRRDACYTQRVVEKAIQSVYQDGMAFRRAADRLARDFWVKPSEGMIRRWCRTYAQQLDLSVDYLPWVVQGFSGVLCVDEVYQGNLALLLAVDPATPQGDRLVGYQLVTGSVTQLDVAAFLTRLRAAGLQPEQVITDGSSLYPNLLQQLWPSAAHQLCLFHETQRITEAVKQVVRTVRASLPHVPAAPAASRPRRTSGLLGRPRTRPLPDDPHDVRVQQWQARQSALLQAKARVHRLHQQGVPLRAIARQTGHSRSTVGIWLQEPPPVLETFALDPPSVPESLPFPAAPEGSHPATAPAQVPPPSAPWTDWEEIRAIQRTLAPRRYLMLHRPEHLTSEEQSELDQALASPVGTTLQIARDFVVEWYGFWTDEQGQRRSLVEAQTRYQAWCTNPAYQSLAPLQQVIQAVDAARFQHLSHFLKNPRWEATNNGAERGGRLFRHLQGPHFNLRTTTSIEHALTVQSYQSYESAVRPVGILPGRSTRGRKPVTLPLSAAA
ncbi:MAG: hypothetical protein H0T73_17645 [Ardenticatenales bacterium]|nr:hypothetical protein [Ardenticatenales bacterium]